MPHTGKKKICFIAHEFGYFKNHGGIATYLHNTVRTLLEHYDFDISVLTQKCDPNDPLADKIKLREIKSDADTLDLLLEIEPDFVETTDYRTFGYQAMMYKAMGRGLLDTVFIVNHHTNMKECFVWTEELPFTCAPDDMQREHVWELAKSYLADQNIAPSDFMAGYVEQLYGLDHVHAFKSVFIGTPTPRAISVDIADKFPDLKRHAFNVCCIARFEGRKKQEFLVQQFVTFLRRSGAKANLLLAGNSCLSDIDEIDYVNQVYSSVPDEYRDRVHFFDFLNQKQQIQILGASDLYVLPSTFESFGFSIVETVYRGLPIMCSKYCGTAEAMGEEHEHMTFDPFAPDDLSLKIEDFYNRSQEERSHIADSQQKSFANCLGPQVLKEKVETLFEPPSPTRLTDVTALPCVYITENGVEGQAGPDITHYILGKEVDHYVGGYLNFHMQLSPKLQDAVLVFGSGLPPIDIEDALERGFTLALPATHLDLGIEPYQDFIHAALRKKCLLPIHIEADHAVGYSKKFYNDLISQLPTPPRKIPDDFSTPHKDVWASTPEEIDEIQKRIMSAVLVGVGLENHSKPNAEPVDLTHKTKCVFIGKKGVLSKIPDSQTVHYILGSDIVQPIIDFMNEQVESDASLHNTVLAFHATKTPPRDIIQALAMGCSLALPFSDIKCGQIPYKDLINHAVQCATFTPVALTYKQKKILPFYGHALRRTHQINMKDLFHG